MSSNNTAACKIQNFYIIKTLNNVHAINANNVKAKKLVALPGIEPRSCRPTQRHYKNLVDCHVLTIELQGSFSSVLKFV